MSKIHLREQFKYAVLQSDLSQVQSLLDDDPDLVEGKYNHYERTVLQEQTYKAYRRISRENNGYYEGTILQLAVEYGVRQEIIELLFTNIPQGYLDVKDNEGKTVLHAALGLTEFSINEQIIELLITRMSQATIGEADKQGNTALHLAAANTSDGHIVEMLLTKMKDVDIYRVTHPYGWNALYYAKHLRVAKLLLTKFCLETEDRDRKTPLHIAARNGHYSIVELFLTKMSQQKIDAIDNEGNTALHHALISANYSNNDKTIEALVAKTSQAAINVANKHGSTVLHLAAENVSNVEIVEKLLVRMSKAAICASDIQGRTALHQVTHVSIAELLLTKISLDIVDSRGQNTLRTAIEHQCCEVFDFLLTKTSQEVINTTDRYGNTILHDIAVRWYTIDDYGHRVDNADMYLKIVASLFTRIDLGAVNLEGQTALHLACEHTNNEIAKLLIAKMDQKAINVKNYSAETALYIALTRNGDHTLIALLITKAAQENIDERDCNGNTLLQLAASIHNRNIIDLLLTRMSQQAIDNIDNFGESALQSLMHNVGRAKDTEEILNSLIIRMDHTLVDLINHDGKSILHLAASADHNLIRLLLPKMNQKAINAIDKQGNTALHSAMHNTGLHDISSSLISVAEDGTCVSCVTDNDETYTSVAKKGKIDAIGLLISSMNQETINQANDNGMTAIELAIRNGGWASDPVVDLLQHKISLGLVLDSFSNLRNQSYIPGNKDYIEKITELIKGYCDSSLSILPMDLLTIVYKYIIDSSWTKPVEFIWNNQGHNVANDGFNNPVSIRINTNADSSDELPINAPKRQKSDLCIKKFVSFADENTLINIDEELLIESEMIGRTDHDQLISFHEDELGYLISMHD